MRSGVWVSFKAHSLQTVSSNHLKVLQFTIWEHLVTTLPLQNILHTKKNESLNNIDFFLLACLLVKIPEELWPSLIQHFQASFLLWVKYFATPQKEKKKNLDPLIQKEEVSWISLLALSQKRMKQPACGIFIHSHEWMLPYKWCTLNYILPAVKTCVFLQWIMFSFGSCQFLKGEITRHCSKGNQYVIFFCQEKLGGKNKKS